MEEGRRREGGVRRTEEGKGEGEAGMEKEGRSVKNRDDETLNMLTRGRILKI